MTLDVTHSEGNFPVWRDFLKLTLIIGAISSLISFSNKGLSVSGHAAFPDFRIFRSFKRPLRDISMSGMTGMELRFGSGTDSEGRLPSSTKSCTFIWARRERERGDFFVKTDWNGWLHRLALAGVSVKRV